MCPIRFNFSARPTVTLGSLTAEKWWVELGIRSGWGMGAVTSPFRNTDRIKNVKGGERESREGYSSFLRKQMFEHS